MTESAKLRLPYIAASQAQKHVTHNEALTLLDTLCQASVIDKDLTTPPMSPDEGDCYIVAATGTDAWSGWDSRIARYIDGEWRSYLPGAGDGKGWLVYVQDEDALYVFDGSAWGQLYVDATPGLATTTEILTGTETTKAVTPDALAALWEKGSNVASAATVSLGEGGFFHITGTTTITDIDFATPKDGRFAWVVFDGVLTLTHNGTTLILPGGANIVTAAGDRALFVQDSGDNVVCLAYVRAAGQARKADVQDFTSSGTWTKPDGAKLVYVLAVAPGGGAGGGARVTSGNPCSGGGGGGGGAATWAVMLASALGSTETVTIGAAGVGGAGATADNTAGSNGTSAGISRFSNLTGNSQAGILTVGGGGGGAGGQLNAAAGCGVLARLALSSPARLRTRRIAPMVMALAPWGRTVPLLAPVARVAQARMAPPAGRGGDVSMVPLAAVLAVASVPRLPPSTLAAATQPDFGPASSAALGPPQGEAARYPLPARSVQAVAVLAVAAIPPASAARAPTAATTAAAAAAVAPPSAAMAARAAMAPPALSASSAFSRRNGMAPKRMAVVDADGNIDNVILIEDGADWTPPDGMSMVEAGRDAEAGGTYVKGKFARAAAPEPATEQPSLEERVAALAADVEALKSLRIR